VDSVVVATSREEVLQAVGVVQGLLSSVQAAQAALAAASGPPVDSIVAVPGVKGGGRRPGPADPAPDAAKGLEVWAQPAAVAPTRMQDLPVAVSAGGAAAHCWLHMACSSS
jgi:hypothetical protein